MSLRIIESSAFPDAVQSHREFINAFTLTPTLTHTRPLKSVLLSSSFAPMERYSRVEKPKLGSPINENEIRITSVGLIRNYISYAITLLHVLLYLLLSLSVTV